MPLNVLTLPLSVCECVCVPTIVNTLCARMAFSLLSTVEVFIYKELVRFPRIFGPFHSFSPA